MDGASQRLSKEGPGERKPGPFRPTLHGTEEARVVFRGLRGQRNLGSCSLPGERAQGPVFPTRSGLCSAQRRTGINTLLTKDEGGRRHFLSSQVGPVSHLHTLGPQGLRGRQSYPSGNPEEKSLSMLGWKLPRPQATPHDHTLGSLHIFRTF